MGDQIVDPAGAACVLLVCVPHGREIERAKAGEASAERDSGDRLAEVIGERTARQEEQRRATVQEEARAHAQEERTIADAGAAGADAVGERLQYQGAKLAATVSCPGTDAAAVARVQAATRAAAMLSELRDNAGDPVANLSRGAFLRAIAGHWSARTIEVTGQSVSQLVESKL